MAARSPQPDEVREFVDEVVRTGLMLADLLARLLDDLPEDAFAGEDNAEVLFEMLTGSLRPAATAAGERVVREATALLRAVQDRTLADLRA